MHDQAAARLSHGLQDALPIPRRDRAKIDQVDARRRTRRLPSTHRCTIAPQVTTRELVHLPGLHGALPNGRT